MVLGARPSKRRRDPWKSAMWFSERSSRAPGRRADSSEPVAAKIQHVPYRFCLPTWDTRPSLRRSYLSGNARPVQGAAAAGAGSAAAASSSGAQKTARTTAQRRMPLLFGRPSMGEGYTRWRVFRPGRGRRNRTRVLCISSQLTKGIVFVWKACTMPGIDACRRFSFSDAATDLAGPPEGTEAGAGHRLRARKPGRDLRVPPRLLHAAAAPPAGLGGQAPHHHPGFPEA